MHLEVPYEPIMIRILVVEDEVRLSQMLTNNLTYAGFEVVSSSGGEDALARHQEKASDLIILDLMLPGMDGFEVLERLRGQNDSVPILMLTARGGEGDRVKGLTLGADDYISKPFSLLELIARVRAILRRSQGGSVRPGILRSGDYRIDLATLSLHKDGEQIELSGREFRLLEALLSRPGKTLSRRELVQQAWPADNRPAPRTVDVHILGLRRKLGEEGKSCIATVGGEGYRWTLPVERE